jgi:hypothetical protein
MYKDNFLSAREDNVRFARQVWLVQVIPDSHRVQHRANNNLRPSVLALDRRHALTSLFRCEYVHGSRQPPPNHLDKFIHLEESHIRLRRVLLMNASGHD